MPTFDKGLRFAGAAALFAALLVPLIVVPGQMFPFIAPRAQFFRLCVDAATVCLGLLILRGVMTFPRLGVIGVCFGLYAAAMLAADLMAWRPSLALFSTIERFDGYMALVWAFGYFAAAAALLRGLWRHYLAGMMIVAFLALGAAVYQLAGWFATGFPTPPRVYGSIGNPSYLGTYAALCLFLAAWLWKAGWRRWAALGFASSLVSLVLSQTRGAVLGAILGGLAAMWLSGRWRAKQIAIFGLASLVLAGMVAYALPDWPSLARFRPTIANERWEVWAVALDAFTRHPVLGWGHEGFAQAFLMLADKGAPQGMLPYDRAHNLLLDKMVEGGLLGAGAYVALFLAAASAARKQPILIGFLVCYAVSNMFLFEVLVTQAAFLAFLAMLVGGDVAQRPGVVAHGEPLHDGRARSRRAERGRGHGHGAVGRPRAGSGELD
ncbi:MAG: O-antigen ligase family protein [Pseudomonadota bacterium]